MSALVHRAGHQITLDIKDKMVIATAHRRQPDGTLMEVGSFGFGDKDAKLAGLHEKDTYKAYPKIMWGWRAITGLCRFYFGDVVSGMAASVPEELNISAEDAPIEAISEDVDILVEGESLAIETATAEMAGVPDAAVGGEV